MKSSREADELTIGAAAARFGLATHVLRHWESVGLLAPARAVAGRRRYGPGHLYRIAMIVRAKEAGFALDDIREMFACGSPADRTAVLRRHRATLAERIARAQASLDLIDCALECRHDDLATCPHFLATIADRVGLPAPAVSSGRTPHPDRSGRSAAARVRARGRPATASPPGR